MKKTIFVNESGFTVEKVEHLGLCELTQVGKQFSWKLEERN